MDEALQEFVDSRGAAMRVDRQHGVIRGVKLLGLESRNGRRYLPEALTGAVELYEAAKVNVNHPKGSPLATRDYQERIGIVRNVRWEQGRGLFGDLHFNPKHMLAEQLIWDAEHAPENVGLSHNVQARTARHGDETVVESILKVQSVDLVADPATIRGLFEHAGQRSESGCETFATLSEALAGLTIEQIQEQRSDLVRLLTENVEREHVELTARLQAEVDQLRAAAAAEKKQNVIRRLLEEYRLPYPSANDASNQAMVGPTFLASLQSAADETAIRELVRERASLIESIRRTASFDSDSTRPLSQEQNRSEPAALDAQRFARAIC